MKMESNTPETTGPGSNRHPDPNDLARLVDRGPDAVDPSVLEHLAGCAECQAAWAEAARYRGASVLEGEEYDVPQHLAAIARDMRVPAAQGESASSVNVIKTSRRLWRPAPAWSAGGALLAAVLALVILMPTLRGGDPSDPADPAHAEILAHLESQSGWGMVYPGATGAGEAGRPVYRSGDGADSDLLQAIEMAEADWHADSSDPDKAWWLAAAYASAGRLGLASDLTHQALRDHPDHLGLLHLQAITAWQLSEFDRAEHALQRILSRAPADSVALFNLALIQLDTDRGDEAEPVLRALAAGSSNSLLQERAREVLTR